MDRLETIRLFRIAHDEIKNLRRANAELEPRAHAYDTIAAIARFERPQYERGMGLDIAWELARAVETLQAEPATEEGEKE